MIAGLGHNSGPTMEGGHSWRKHAWGRARADLLPRLPIEVLRLRVARAKELGLPYKTYASVRASTGRDVVGFLFSSNALRLLKEERLAADRALKLDSLKNCSRVAIIHRPFNPEDILRANAPVLDGAMSAPGFTARWSDIRQRMLEAALTAKAPADGLLLVGDTTLEREWSAAGRLAGYLTAGQYFGGAQ